MKENYVTAKWYGVEWHKGRGEAVTVEVDINGETVRIFVSPKGKRISACRKGRVVVKLP